MWKEWISGYLTFTRKERTGVLSLVVIIIAVTVVPYFLKKPPGSADPAAFVKYQPAAGQLVNKKPVKEAVPTEIKETVPPEIPFYFDPNRIRFDDWKRLGVRDPTIHIIEHFLQRGGKFRSAADLEKIYGLKPSDCKRLQPYVRIPPERQNENRNLHPVFHREPHAAAFFSPAASHYPQKKPSVIDVNRADSEALIRLPGIGMKLAGRIIHFREKLGGFFEVAQVAETFGLSDSVFQSIRPWLSLAADTVRQVDLNLADQPALQQHPYIRWDLARAILRYRDQHGGFRSVEELKQLVQVTPEKFRKLEPYLKVGR
jgi:competence protein ComEA